jgi:hypothetical protein
MDERAKERLAAKVGAPRWRRAGKMDPRDSACAYTRNRLNFPSA